MTAHNETSRPETQTEAPYRGPRWRFWAGLSILLMPVLLFVAFSLTKTSYVRLPIYGERTPLANGDTLYHRVPAFRAVDQTGKPFGSDSLAGRMHVASFIFTTCPSICPKVSGEMQAVQKEIDNAWEQSRDIRLISFSIDPRRDSVPALAAYAQRYGAKADRWKFLTGMPEDSVLVWANGYLASAVRDSSEASGGFSHTPLLMLVDDLGRVRGFYDSLKSGETKRLGEEIKVLRLEILERQGKLPAGTTTPPYPEAAR